MNLVYINGYIIDTFVYEYMHGSVIDIFNNFSKEIEISMDWIFAMQMTFMYHMGDLM